MAGLLDQVERGLDDSMPSALRPAWQAVTPALQKKKSDEAARAQARIRALREGGSDAEPADAQVELERYREHRQ